MDEELKTTIPLESVILDPRNEEELVTKAQIRVFNESNGLLNDFTDNSPLAALIQGQAFAASELLYYVNKLPLALIIDFLKITGVERSLGTKAVVDLQFYLSAPLNNTFIIPQGFEVVDETGVYSFYTNSPLTIPPGLISGTVSATAETVGSNYNLPAYSITGITQPLTFLSSVTNPSPSNGGTDAESESSTIKRALDKLRLRNLVSADDYEQAAQEILGVGSRAVALGRLGPNKEDSFNGAVHLFLLNSNGEPANSTQLNLVKNELTTRISLGSFLFVSPIELFPVNGDLIAKLISNVDPEEAADILFQSFEEYLNPALFPEDRDVIIKEIEYRLRLTGVIEDIQLFNINGDNINIEIDKEYILPFAQSLVMEFIRDDNSIYRVNRGQLDLL